MLPPQMTLQALLDYDPVTGLLRWKQRPRSMFNCDRLFNSWNTRYANRIAFTAVDRKGYNVGAILGVNYRASRVIFKLITNIEPNQVDHEDGNTLNNHKVAYGKPFKVKMVPAPGFTYGDFTITHGDQIESLKKTDIAKDGTYTIPAKWMDDNVTIECIFISTSK